MLFLNKKGGVKMYKEIFPTRIKKARLDAGYTQEQVSENTGISQSNIAKYETGKLEPTLENLGTLAQFYNVSLNWLLGVTLEPNIPEPPKKPKIKITHENGQNEKTSIQYE